MVIVQIYVTMKKFATLQIKCFYDYNATSIGITLRPPAHPFEAILLYDRNQLKLHVILSFRLPKPYIK